MAPLDRLPAIPLKLALARHEHVPRAREMLPSKAACMLPEDPKDLIAVGRLAEEPAQTAGREVGTVTGRRAKVVRGAFIFERLQRRHRRGYVCRLFCRMPFASEALGAVLLGHLDGDGGAEGGVHTTAVLVLLLALLVRVAELPPFLLRELVQHRFAVGRCVLALELGAEQAGVPDIVGSETVSATEAEE